MAALLIKNLPSALHESLRTRAERNHRSMTKEVITIIEHALGKGDPLAPTVAPVPPLRHVTTFKLRKPLTAQFIDRVIRKGRDARG